MNFFILCKGTDAYDITKKKIVYLIPFHKTEFSNSFCQRFFDSPFIEGSKFQTFEFSELFQSQQTVISFEALLLTFDWDLQHLLRNRVFYIGAWVFLRKLFANRVFLGILSIFLSKIHQFHKLFFNLVLNS